MLRSEWLVQIFADDDEGDACIGTGYAIGNNLIITARHVVYARNRAKKPNLKLVWPEQKDRKKHEVLFTDEDIIFDGRQSDEGKYIDIAVIRCPEPLKLNPPQIKLSHLTPKATTSWSSRGYLRAGKQGETRTSKGVIGNIAGYKNHNIELTAVIDVTKEEGWGGLSGAPVFINDTELVAIITDRYTTLERYLESVSIPFLLSNNNDFCKAIGHSVNKLIPKEDGTFNQQLSKKLIETLGHSDAKLLLTGFKKRLNIYDNETKILLTNVVNKLLTLDTDEAIRALTGVIDTCISNENIHDQIHKLKQFAEEVLGWLVLSSIDEKEVSKHIQECANSESLYFVLGHTTLGGVELIMSRSFRRKTSWSGKDTPEPYGRNHIFVESSSFTEDDDEEVRKLLVDLWNRVFDSPKEKKEEHEALTSHNIRILNSTIKSRLNSDNNIEHFY